jgi:hypothetical protein
VHGWSGVTGRSLTGIDKTNKLPLGNSSSSWWFVALM